MPRDVNGNYTLPAGNPVVTNTVISSTWANTTLSDLSTAMTNSLDRTGTATGMTGQFKAISGTIGAPGISFGAETTTGIYRAGVNDIRFAVAGVDVLKFSGTALLPTTIQAGNGAVGAPSYSWASESTSGWYRAGANDLRFSVAGVDVLQVLTTGLVSVQNMTAKAFIPTAATVPVNGMYLSAANQLGFATATAVRMTLDSTGLIFAAATGYTANAASTIIAAGAGLTLKGAAAGASNIAYMQFLDSGGARKGYIGDANSADSDIYLESDAGNVKFIPASSAFSAQMSLDGGTTFFDLGWRDMPNNDQAGNYTLALTDRGKLLRFFGAGGITYTIPANGSIAFPVGTVIAVVNEGSASLSIAITTDILQIAGAATTGTRTLAVNGLITLTKVASTTWYISGVGFT